MKKRFIKLAVLCLSIVLSLALLEGLCTAYAWAKYGKIQVQELQDATGGNAFVAGTRLPYESRLMPHPYLGWVYGEDGHGNNVGLHADNFPMEHDDNFVTILVVGGSVADNLVSNGDLKTALQNRCDFGKPVRLLCGAAGAWQQPQQAILVLLYGDVVDAIVSIDGFNEQRAFAGGNARLEHPRNTFVQLNPMLSGGPERLGAFWQMQRLRDLAIDTNSRAIFFATRVISDRIIKSLPEPSNSIGTVDSIFKMPADWPRDRRDAYNLELYKKYTTSIDALAEQYDLPVAHFIQCCPAIGKTLTAEEKQAVGPLDYAEQYQRMADAMLALNDEQVTVISLLDVFQGVNETVYVDAVHCGTKTPGYRLMSERIADELAQAWDVGKGSDK